jgi:CBS domain-containing protein
VFDELVNINVGELVADFSPVDGYQPAYEVLGLLEDSDLFSIPVRLEKGYGVIQLHSMLSVRSLDTKVAAFAKKVPPLRSDTTVGAAARLMVENRVQVLPVVDGSSYKGVVTASDVLRMALRKSSRGLSISAIMTPKPYTLDAEDTLGSAVRLFVEKKIDHLPVLDKGKVSGVVRSKDALLVLLRPGEKVTHGSWGLEALGQKRLPVGGMTLEPVVSELNADYAEALKAVLGSRGTYTLVMLGEELQGIATLRDFLKPLAEDRRTIELPISVSGLTDDILADEAVKQKLRRLAVYVNKTVPSVFNIDARIKRVGPSGKQFEVDVKLYTPRKTINLSDSGHDLLQVFDELERRLKQSIKQEVSPPKKRFLKRVD